MDIPNKVCPKCNGQQIVFEGTRIYQCDVCEGQGHVTETEQKEYLAKKAQEAKK